MHTVRTFLRAPGPPLHIRFEKYDHSEGKHRYCQLSLTPTLFGDWCVERVSGPLNAPGGVQKRTYFAAQAEAMAIFERFRDRQMKRGYAPIPVQLGLL